MKGYINTILILIVLFFAILLGGNLFSDTSTEDIKLENPISVAGSQCCDLGTGDQCRPYNESEKEALTYNNEKYGLLKSGVTMSEAPYHLKDTGEKFQDNPIIISTADGYIPLMPQYVARFPECVGKDTVHAKNSQGCVGIPNDQIVYVCRENCDAPIVDPEQYCAQNDSQINTTVPAPGNYTKGLLSCFGDETTIFDIYFRLSDYPAPGVPDIIKNCEVSTDLSPTTQIILEPNVGPADENLQLGSFKIDTIPLTPGGATWLSPWCKPAIYLYPERKTDVNVKVEAPGGLTATLPLYPSSGWDVTAYPGGQLNYLGTNLDYLYYESRVPDELINEPKQGYVVKYDDLFKRLDRLLTELGLNQKERTDFIAYWQKVLPKENYYFIGLIEQKSLEKLADLVITPEPKTEIRVTVLFKALDEPVAVEPPKLESVNRVGFTVVEWGGIVRSEEGEFSCLM